MVFLIIVTITVVSYFIMVLVLFFLPLSQRIHSFWHIPRLVFLLLPDPPRHFWLGWLVKKWGRGPPECLILEEGVLVFHFEARGHFS